MTRKLKIGYFVTDLGTKPGYEDVVSAHVQIPLHSIKLLTEAGHSVQLIANELDDGLTFPAYMPRGITVHQVTDGRTTVSEGYKTWPPPNWPPPKGSHPLDFVKQLRQIRRIVETEQYDLLHLFGGNRMGFTAGLLSLFGVKVPLILTHSWGNFPGPYWFLTRFLWRRLSLLVTSTEYVGRTFSDYEMSTKVIKHGIVKNLGVNARSAKSWHRNRVLFWRDASLGDGIDVCLAVYDALADRFPAISFDIAVRPQRTVVRGIKELSEKHKNVNVYEFPYRDGLSLSTLLRESICVLMPFRRLSINPQFAVLESLFAGAAVITTYCESNSELITSGEDGLLVPVGDIGATIKAVEDLLNNPKRARTIGDKAACNMRRKYTWDNYAEELITSYNEVLKVNRAA